MYGPKEKKISKFLTSKIILFKSLKIFVINTVLLTKFFDFVFTHKNSVRSFKMMFPKISSITQSWKLNKHKVQGF